jgi:hypothetical protein
VSAFNRDLIAQIVARLDRRMKGSLARSESRTYMTTGSDTLRHALAGYDNLLQGRFIRRQRQGSALGNANRGYDKTRSFHRCD